ncbi:MAG: TRAP-type C4-dicarboxylate transport system permease large subunit [Paracoccaceae bacterium]|jgi:TRAP-type C4-dicarboxylate transport system permease large subunit
MWIVLPVFVALLICGAAFAYLMGVVSGVSFLVTDRAQYLSVLPLRIFTQVDVFAFMAMPRFILTAELMTRSGVTRALIDVSMSVVGRFKGGLGHVNVLTSAVVAGISGSAVADAAARSRIFVPAMVERGHDKHYDGPITAALLALNAVIAHRKNHPGDDGPDLPRFWPSLRAPAPALMLPVVMLGNPAFGLATPTEGSAPAATMALPVGRLTGA